MISPQLTARSLATLRGRFEALRGFGPMPAVMAEVPAGCDPEFKLSGGLPRPPIRHLDRDDLHYLGGAAVLCPDLVRDPLSAPVRHVWVACDPSAIDRLRHAFAAAARFAGGARALASLAAESGAGGDEPEWLWTLFEVAEKDLSSTPLRLRSGRVTVASGELHFAAHQVAAVRANPDRQDFMAKGIRRAAPAPTRYWEIDDVVEASLQLLDIAEAGALVPISTTAGKATPSEGSPSKRGGRPRKRFGGLDLSEALIVLAKRDHQVAHMAAKDIRERLLKVYGVKCGKRTIERHDTYRSWRQAVSDQVKDRGSRLKGKSSGSPNRPAESRYDLDSDGLNVAPAGRITSGGRPRLTPKEADLDRQGREYLKRRESGG